ncbi:FAD-dependent oxidoreductase [Sanguibacter sp. 25GB23B1]|uniref:FAD-dependent oxidoreductase n=1 Tax=unclassified Sanguibacter TaxID=2645534 RepID=UPI0032AE9E4F
MSAERSTGGSPATDTPARRTRVVVVGNGMVGSRFIDDLLSRDGDASFEVTVLGTEGYEPYNRVLLSEVVAGKVDVASLALPALTHERATVRRGAQVLHVDRRTQQVLADDGTTYRYDVLVLATGSAARIPAVRGLSEGLPAGVHALRTLDDAREIVAATVNARRAVVIGAGVLGLEAACGLARRGLAVTVVHGGTSLMDRQLGVDAALVAARTLAQLGVDHRVDARTDEVLTSDGRVTGIRVGVTSRPDDLASETLPADLVVLACGTVPETGIATAAGLPVDRGIVVTDALSSPADPRIFAIGDCAQPPEGASGLIAQGWDQSRRLATHLAARVVDESQFGRVRLGGARLAPHRPSLALRLSLDPGRPDGPSVLSRRVDGTPGSGDTTRGTDVVRLKAAGLDVVSMGTCGARRTPSPGERTVRLSDPDAGRHVEVTVAGGLVVGATCVGAPQIGADLTAAYTRRTPVPADPAYLLLQPVASAAATATDPTHMPDRTTVCRCNGVSKGDIVACFHGGATTVADVAKATRATTGCGGCTQVVCGLVDWLSASTPGTGESSADERGADERGADRREPSPIDADRPGTGAGSETDRVPGRLSEAAATS